MTTTDIATVSIEVDAVDSSRAVIVSQMPMRDKGLIMTLPGSRYDSRAYKYTVPLTWATCIAMRGIYGDLLRVGPNLSAWAWNERNNRINPAMALRTAWDSEGDDDLYPFQRAGVEFGVFSRRWLLADPMGTGKTVQAIRTLRKLHNNGENVFPCIIVAPNNMLITWQRELQRWWPGVTSHVIKGSAAVRRKLISSPGHFWIINYEGIRAHSRLAPFGSIKLKKCVVCDPTLPNIASNAQTRCEHCKKELNRISWRSIIVDEAHKLKEPKSKQTRAVWALRTDQTEFVMGLTGTAIADAPDDMWPILHLISRNEFPDRQKYVDRYCSQSFNPFGGMKIVSLAPGTRDEFFTIVDPRMRRMPKEAVLPHLPPKTYVERYVDMTTKQQRAYDQMEDGLISILDGEGDAGILVAANPLVQLTRLSQFASSYCEVDVDGSVKLIGPSNKVDALLEIVEEMSGESLVVFAQSRQLIELACDALEKNGVSFSKIVGGQNQYEREKAKDDFQAGRVQVILCTISAGGVGITLTRAGTAVFLQRSWSMIDNAQAEDRVHRIGSEIHDKVQIIDILSTNTLEERQRVVLGTKLERLEEVMRDRETLMRLLGKAR